MCWDRVFNVGRGRDGSAEKRRGAWERTYKGRGEDGYRRGGGNKNKMEGRNYCVCGNSE